jgi:hypothetical protein
LRHLAYAGGWKKFEPLWDLLIRSKQVLHALPVLETILTGFGSRPAKSGPAARLAPNVDPALSEASVLVDEELQVAGLVGDSNRSGGAPIELRS